MGRRRSSHRRPAASGRRLRRQARRYQSQDRPAALHHPDCTLGCPGQRRSARFGPLHRPELLVGLLHRRTGGHRDQWRPTDVYGRADLKCGSPLPRRLPKPGPDGAREIPNARRAAVCAIRACTGHLPGLRRWRPGCMCRWFGRGDHAARARRSLRRSEFADRLRPVRARARRHLHR